MDNGERTTNYGLPKNRIPDLVCTALPRPSFDAFNHLSLARLQGLCSRKEDRE